MCDNEVPTQPDVLTAHVFKIFDDIRKMLVEEGGIRDLPLDFPIVEMPYSDEMSNYLGMCHFTQVYDIHKAISTQAVDRISMRVLCKPSENLALGQRFHILRLIPTLLHEFAHATCELGRTLPSDECQLRNRKLKKLDDCAHDDLFYGHFRRILKAAELLGIYSLPNSTNRYNCPSLRRFDQVDKEECPLYLCGSSKLYDGAINLDKKDEVEIIKPIATSVILNLTIINTNGVKKAVQLKNGDLDALLQAATKKFGLKANFKITTPQGIDICSSNFETIKTGSTLHIRLQESK